MSPILYYGPVDGGVGTTSSRGLVLPTKLSDRSVARRAQGRAWARGGPDRGRRGVVTGQVDRDPRVPGRPQQRDHPVPVRGHAPGPWDQHESGLVRLYVRHLLHLPVLITFHSDTTPEQARNHRWTA